MLTNSDLNPAWGMAASAQCPTLCLQTEELWEGSHAGWELGVMTMAQKQGEPETSQHLGFFPLFPDIEDPEFGKKVGGRAYRRLFIIY